MKFLLLIVLVVALMLAYFGLTRTDAAPTIVDSELHIASAYACGMLDALQEKRHRPSSCDEYRTIAKKKGVSVPP